MAIHINAPISREEARKLIKSNYVKCGGTVIDKPSYDVTDGTDKKNNNNGGVIDDVGDEYNLLAPLAAKSFVTIEIPAFAMQYSPLLTDAV